MKHLRPLNKKALRIEVTITEAQDPAVEEDVVALQTAAKPHVPMGCSLAFSPGWEVDSSGGTAGLCQPVERDIFDCYVTCFWPVQVPDHMNYSPNWTGGCAVATKDWRDLDIIFR